MSLKANHPSKTPLDNQHLACPHKSNIGEELWVVQINLVSTANLWGDELHSYEYVRTLSSHRRVRNARCRVTHHNFMVVRIVQLHVARRDIEVEHVAVALGVSLAQEKEFRE